MTFTKLLADKNVFSGHIYFLFTSLGYTSLSLSLFFWKPLQTNHLNLTKSRRFQDSAQAVDQPEKTDTDNEKEKDERNAGRGVEMRPRINSQVTTSF